MKGQVDLECQTAWVVLQVWGCLGIQGGYSSLLGLWFIPKEYNFFLQWWRHSQSIICGSQQWSLHNFIPIQLHQGCHTPMKVLCCIAQYSGRHPQHLCSTLQSSGQCQGFFLPSNPEVPWSILMLLPGQGVTWRPQPATRQVVGCGHSWSHPLSSPCKEL